MAHGAAATARGAVAGEACAARRDAVWRQVVGAAPPNRTLFTGAAAPAAASGLLVSTLLWEGPRFASNTLHNLLDYTAPSTEIVWHASRGMHAPLRSKLEGYARSPRLHLNPVSVFTDHLKNVWYGHLLNVWHAAKIGLAFDTVALCASNARFVRRGVEAYVRTGYSSLGAPAWLRVAETETETRAPAPREFTHVLGERRGRSRAGTNPSSGRSRSGAAFRNTKAPSSAPPTC